MGNAFGNLVAKVFVLGFFIYGVTICNAQDRIITYSKDTIDCTIISVDDDFIYFSLPEYGESTISKIPLAKVATYTDNFVNEVEEDVQVEQQNDDPVKDKPSDENPIVNSKSEVSKLRFAVNFGPSYVFTWNESVPAGYEQYYKNLAYGGQFNSNLAFYFNRFMGFGFQCNGFNSKNEADLVIYMLDGSIAEGQIQDNIYHGFIGPSYNFRIAPDHWKNSIHFVTSMGWVPFRNESAFLNKITITGGTVGVYSDVSYDLMVYRGFGIGINAGFTFAALREYEIDNGSTKVKEVLPIGTTVSLTRADVGIGIRFNQ